jgi:hypothetical protein
VIITKKALNRRTLLKGLGVGLALPLLDAMVPSLTAQAVSAANPVKRLASFICRWARTCRSGCHPRRAR